MDKRARLVAYFALGLIIGHIAGHLLGGLDEAGLAANRYCEMVYNGHWPDYQGNYAQFCNKDKWNGK